MKIFKEKHKRKIRKLNLLILTIAKIKLKVEDLKKIQQE